MIIIESMALALPLSLKALWRNSSSVLLGADRINTNHVPPCISMCIHVSYRTMILFCSLNVLQPFGSCRFSDLDPVLHSLASYEISPSRSSSSKLKSVYASSMGGLHASNPFSLELVVLLHVVHLSLSESFSRSIHFARTASPGIYLGGLASWNLTKHHGFPIPKPSTRLLRQAPAVVLSSHSMS